MASPLERTRSSDKQPDSQRPDGQTNLDGLHRLDLLKQVTVLPQGESTAKLTDVQLAAAQPGVKPFVANDGTPAKPAEVAPPVPAPAPAADTAKTGQEAAIKTLQSGDATAQQKIEAVSKLYDSMPKDKHGRVHVTIHDGDKEKQFEISKEKMGHGVNLTHLNFRDAKGHVHPVLRGVERKSGIEQEQGKDGKAGFAGDWWSKHSKESAVTKFANSDAAPPAPAPERHQPRHDERQAPEPHERQQAPVPPTRPEREPQPHPQGKPHEGAPEDHSRHPRHPHHPHHPRRSHAQDDNQSAEPQRDQAPPEHAPRRSEKPERAPQTAPSDNDQSDSTRPQRGGFAKESDLHKFWSVQPSNFECGSASEAMAISHITGRRPFSGAEIHQLSRENGSLGAGAFPHGPGNRNMEEQLKSHGVNAQTHSFGHSGAGEMAKLNEELDKGHSAVAYIRNPATGHGHFIFIEGKTAPDANGNVKYVVGDPGSHRFINKPAVSQRDLNSWLTGEKRGDAYFVSVW